MFQNIIWACTTFSCLKELPIFTKDRNFNFNLLFHVISCTFPVHNSFTELKTDLLTQTFSSSHQFKCITNFTGLICQMKDYYFHFMNAKISPKELFSQTDFYFQKAE